MKDDLGKRLSRWGSAPTPPADANFADTLERDLRSQAYFTPARASAQPRLLRPAVLVFSSALAIFGVWFVVRTDSPPPSEVVMSRPSDTQITLPGQTPTRPTNDVTLPDGTRIAVEDDGSAVVDGVVLDGGTEAVVENGRIEIFPAEPTPSPTAAPVSIATPEPEPSSTPDTPAQPTPEDEPTIEPTVAPTVTPSPTPAPTAEPTTTPVDPGPIEITLQVQSLGEPSLLLTWTAEPRDDLAGWEVVVISGDRQRSIALLRDPGLRELEVERPDAEGVQYIVRARAEGGLVLGESNPAG